MSFLHPKNAPMFLGGETISFVQNLCWKYLHPIQTLEKLLKKQGAGNTCYVMTSLESDIDGKELPLIKALEDLIWSGSPFIISCIPHKLAYFQGEQSHGPPQRFILKRQL